MLISARGNNRFPLVLFFQLDYGFLFEGHKKEGYDAVHCGVIIQLVRGLPLYVGEASTEIHD